MSLLEMKEMSRRKFIQSFSAAVCVAVTAPMFSGSVQAATAPQVGPEAGRVHRRRRGQPAALTHDAQPLASVTASEEND